MLSLPISRQVSYLNGQNEWINTYAIYYQQLGYLEMSFLFIERVQSHVSHGCSLGDTRIFVDVSTIF
jgi:hypothetical protein